MGRISSSLVLTLASTALLGASLSGCIGDVGKDLSRKLAHLRSKARIICESSNVDDEKGNTSVPPNHQKAMALLTHLVKQQDY